MSPRNHPGEVTPTRRQVLVVGGTALLTAVAGCSELRDLTSDLALEEVNVFNMADQRLEGSVTVVDPGGDTVLERTFDLEHEQDQNSGDVVGDAGEYAVNVELTNTGIRGSSEARTTMSIDDTAEERVGIVFNTNEEYDPIVIRVGTTPKDFLEVTN
jgi:hypothetical protein